MLITIPLNSYKRRTDASQQSAIAAVLKESGCELKRVGRSRNYKVTGSRNQILLLQELMSKVVVSTDGIEWVLVAIAKATCTLAELPDDVIEAGKRSKRTPKVSGRAAQSLSKKATESFEGVFGHVWKPAPKKTNKAKVASKKDANSQSVADTVSFRPIKARQPIVVKAKAPKGRSVSLKVWTDEQIAEVAERDRLRRDRQIADENNAFIDLGWVRIKNDGRELEDQRIDALVKFIKRKEITTVSELQFATECTMKEARTAFDIAEFED